jgi:hypothetical protein
VHIHAPRASSVAPLVLAFAGSLDFVADAFRRAKDGAPNTLHSGA